MNNPVFDENTSLFEIRNYFKSLNKETALGFVEWIEEGLNNIELEIHPLNYVVEILNYLKLSYVTWTYEMAVYEEYEYQRTIKPFFKQKYTKIENRRRNIIVIKYNADSKIIFLGIEKKEHLKLAERVAIEISNYIGYKVKINLKLNF